MPVEVDPQVDSSPAELASPVYEYVEVQPNSGTQTLTISTTGPEATFYIPSNVVNLSRSYIDYDALIASGGSGTGTSAIFWHMHTSFLPIERVTLKTQSGVELVDIADAFLLTKTATFACTKNEDFLSRGPVMGATTVATSWGQNRGCNPSKFPLSVTHAATVATGQYVLNSGNQSGTSYTISAGHTGETAPQHLLTGTSNGAMGWKNRIYLRDLCPHTICSLDRTHYFGENLHLKIKFLPRNKWGSQSSSATAIQTTGAALTKDITVSRLSLWSAYDANLATRSALEQAVASGNGLTVNVPYVEHKQLVSDTSNRHTIDNIYVRGQGSKLMRVYTVWQHNTTTDRLAANLDNANGAKVTGIESYLNGNRIQPKEFGLTEALFSEYWGWIGPTFQGSAINSYRTHQVQFFHVDNFSSSKQSREWFDTDHLESGADLEMQKNYMVRVSKATDALVVSQYSVLMGKLNIQPGHTTWVL